MSVERGLTDPQLLSENHTVLQLAYQATLGRTRADDSLSECRTGGASRQGLRPLGSGPHPTPATGPRVQSRPSTGILTAPPAPAPSPRATRRVSPLQAETPGKPRSLSGPLLSRPWSSQSLTGGPQGGGTLLMAVRTPTAARGRQHNEGGFGAVTLCLETLYCVPHVALEFPSHLAG